MEKINIFCIIVTYNGMKWIDRCLISLRNSMIKINPVIIDNNSQDETVSYIKDHFPESHIILNKVNRGFGQANNQGIEYAYRNGATHFFLLNQDAWINQDTVKRLVDIQEKYKLSIVSPVHLNGRGDSLDQNYFSYTILSEHSIEFVSDLILRSVKSHYLVSNINAAAWMLTKKTVDEIGGFDPVFFHYGEDNNYCQRVKYHKGSIAFVPESFIYHDRETKGNIKMYNKNTTLAMLLTYYADVNYNLHQVNKTRIKLHLINIIMALKFLFKFKFKELGYIINGYIVFISKIQEVSKSIKENRNTSSNWLEIDR